MQHFVHAILQSLHLVWRRTFASDERAEDHAAVARRQESFRHQGEEQDCARQTNNPNNRRDPTMAQKPPKRRAVQREHAFLNAADHSLHPGLFYAMAAFLQQTRAHQRSQRQRDDTGSEDGNHDGDRELAKDAADQSRHENQRNEDGSQRDRHRHNREADLLRAVDGGLKWLLTAFHSAHSVLQKHDRVVNQKSNRQGEGHQRQVVETVSQPAHGDERDQQRQRQSHGGNQRIRGATQESKDHHHHQNKSDDERGFDVDHRVHDALRAIVDRRDADRSRQLRTKLRQHFSNAFRDLYCVTTGPAIDRHDDRRRRHFISAHPKA